MSSNWPVFAAQRKMNQPARPMANTRTMRAMIVQSMFFYIPNLKSQITNKFQ